MSIFLVIALPIMLLATGICYANPIFLPHIGLTSPHYSNPMQEFRSKNFTITFEFQRIQNSIRDITISYDLDGKVNGSVPNTSLKGGMEAQTLGGAYYVFEGTKELTNVENGVHNITLNLKTPEGNDSDTVLFSVNMPGSPPTPPTIVPAQSGQANLIKINYQAIPIVVASMIAMATLASMSLLFFKRNVMKKGIVALTIAILVTTLLSTTIFYYSLTNEKDSKISTLESQIVDLNNQINHPRANIVTALGIADVPPSGNPLGTLEANYSHLWITGRLFNSGAGAAMNVSVNVLAYDSSNIVLLNETVPASSSGLIMFPITLPSNGAHLPYTGTTDIYSQQNVTVRFGVYHTGIFPDTTKYEAIPTYANR